jgi:hypothetical protein
MQSWKCFRTVTFKCANIGRNKLGVFKYLYLKIQSNMITSIQQSNHLSYFNEISCVRKEK